LDLSNEKKIMVLGVKRGARWYLYDESKLFAYTEASEAKNDKQISTIGSVIPPGSAINKRYAGWL
jgi:hypothetical protein